MSQLRQGAPKGTLKYILEVRSFADFDGYLEEFEGDLEDGISDILDAMEGVDQATQRTSQRSNIHTLQAVPRQIFERSVPDRKDRT